MNGEVRIDLSGRVEDLGSSGGGTLCFPGGAGLVSSLDSEMDFFAHPPPLHERGLPLLHPRPSPPIPSRSSGPGLMHATVPPSYVTDVKPRRSHPFSSPTRNASRIPGGLFIPDSSVQPSYGRSSHDVNVSARDTFAPGLDLYKAPISQSIAYAARTRRRGLGWTLACLGM